MILLFLVVFNSHGKSYQRKPKSGSPDPTLSIQGKQKKKLKKVNRKVNKKKAAAAKKSTRDTN
ncbi:MAG: hypothetical protein ACKORJ_01350 [Bacteroidota bacterium]